MSDKDKEPICKPRAYMVRVNGALKIKVQEDIQKGKTQQEILTEALKFYYKNSY